MNWHYQNPFYVFAGSWVEHGRKKGGKEGKTGRRKEERREGKAGRKERFPVSLKQEKSK